MNTPITPPLSRNEDGASSPQAQFGRRTEVAKLAVPVSERDHVRGPVDAPVTLVAYGDFECPDSAQATAVLREVQHRLGERLRLVFRHFPLRHKHPHAQWAAEAAEAAAAQGRFWEMHDQLFVHQHLLGDEHLDLYVTHLELDADRLRRDLAEHVHAARVQADYEGGQRSGVTGTPTFYIDGVRYDGSYDLEPLVAALETASGAS
jgi:protein-disulfide isomerase